MAAPAPVRPPGPSAYVSARLGGVPAPEELERELVDLTASDAHKTHKHATKDLLARTLPRVASHGATSTSAIPTLLSLLSPDGAVSERYAIRYAYYLVQRACEHYGRALPDADADAIVTALAKDASERKGARQILATRALSSAARAGVRGASDAVDSACAAAIERFAVGKDPKGGSKKKIIFKGGAVNAGARAAMGAKRRILLRYSASQPIDLNALPTPVALATAVTIGDPIAARHALSTASAVASAAEPAAAHANLARALLPALNATVADVEHWKQAATEYKNAVDADDKNAAAKAKRALGKERSGAAVYAETPATAAALARLCGTLRARALAERNGNGNDPDAPPDACSRACEIILAAIMKHDGLGGGGGGGGESGGGGGGDAKSPSPMKSPSKASSSSGGGGSSDRPIPPRAALAAVEGLCASNAPRGTDAGAAARAAAWTAMCRGGGGSAAGGDPPALAAAVKRVRDVLNQPRYGGATIATACRAAAAIGEARACARAAGHASATGVVGEKTQLSSLAISLEHVAAALSVGGGVRTEALRALLWLQTPTFLVDVHERVVRKNLSSGGGLWATTDAYFDAPPATPETDGGGCVGGAWRGAEPQRRLLRAIADRAATTLCCVDESEAVAWARMTMDGARAVVAVGPKTAPASAALDVLKARSIHWFPYDRVGGVNADP